MATPVGGTRARLLRDSLYYMIRDSLDDLGWFDAGQDNLPVTFSTEEVDGKEEIPFNTLSLSDEDFTSEYQELGSDFSEHTWTFYLDFYAEDNSIGVHMKADLIAILEGRLPSIGRDDPSFELIDYRLATPTSFGRCEIESVLGDRARNFPKAWQRYWHVVFFQVKDYYGNENDA